VDVKRFKNIEYALNDGNVGKHVDLAIKKISVHTLMDDFKSKILPNICNTPNMLIGLIVNFIYVETHFQLELYY